MNFYMDLEIFQCYDKTSECKGKMMLILEVFGEGGN